MFVIYEACFCVPYYYQSISHICQKIRCEEEHFSYKLHRAIRAGDNCTVDEPPLAAAVQGPICGLVPPALAIALSARG